MAWQILAGQEVVSMVEAGVGDRGRGVRVRQTSFEEANQDPCVKDQTHCIAYPDPNCHDIAGLNSLSFSSLT
ncbi:hypothetical protein E2C01_040269 [Portunus trituberculatus]|uniref:Uncharacterized protein n=1 Tax=Portunus trituberculatus TaxID=210409 RepID=A0A5B7FMW4_PORTR|nr:hypothetical protein [Portunus trituberculatus]